jgi:hypothetical protein
VDETQLKSWLATELRKPFVPDHLWYRLDASTRQLARDDEEERKLLFESAKSYVDYWRVETKFIRQGGYEGRSQSKEEAEPRHLEGDAVGTIVGRAEPIIALDEGQSLAFSSLIAAEAGRDPRVTSIRERRLGSQLLDADQFLKFIMSPANRFLLADDLESRGISPVDHMARVVDRSINDGLTDVSIYPQHVAYTTFSPPGDEHGPQMVEIEIWHKGHTERIKRTTNDQAFTVGYLAPDTESANEITYGQVTGWPGSVLAELVTIAETLSTGAFWRREEVLPFLISGLFPFMDSVQSSVKIYSAGTGNHHYASITVTAVPWAELDTVLARFYAEQQFLLQAKRRAFSKRILALVTFVSTRMLNATLQNRKPPNWGSLNHEWGLLHDEWSFSDGAQLGNAYRRARHRILSYPAPFPRTHEEEFERYDQLRKPIRYEPRMINPQY